MSDRGFEQTDFGGYDVPEAEFATLSAPLVSSAPVHEADSDDVRADAHSAFTDVSAVGAGGGTEASDVATSYDPTWIAVAYADPEEIFSVFADADEELELSSVPAEVLDHYSGDEARVPSQTGLAHVPPTQPLVDTIAGDTSTTSTIAFGQTRVSLIDFQGDQDWYRINVTAGQEFQIDLIGFGVSGIEDTYLRLFDANGNLIAQDDDGGTGLFSQLTGTATVTGTYYISAGGFSSAGFGRNTGEYRLTVIEPAPPPPAGDLEGDQWHLSLLGNIEAIWADYTGSGVGVGIFDDGVQLTHDDLSANYDASRHVTVGGVIQTGDAQDLGGAADIRHGTAVAGLIASADNGVGTVGVAYGSRITGVGIFDGPADLNNAYSGFLEAASQSDSFDVINHSWGRFPGFFQGAIAIDQQLTDLWLDSAANGRGGLGTVHVKSAGNDDENNNGASSYDASRVTITVGAYGSEGAVADYSSYGATLLVSAPTSGGTLRQVTTDMLGSDGYSSEDYTNTANGFGGTSGAAPIVTAVVALMMDANENLGWRDISNIISLSSREIGSGIGGSPDPNENFAWRYNGATDWNGGGRHYSEDFGYGAIDAYNAVRMAEIWSLFGDAQTSANEYVVADFSTGASKFLTDNGVTNFNLGFTGFTGTLVEYINVNVTITHTDFSQLTITLVSPSGTRSILYDGHVSGSQSSWEWSFGANGFRGEALTGTWSVEIADDVAGSTGTANVSLDFFSSDRMFAERKRRRPPSDRRVLRCDCR